MACPNESTNGIVIECIDCIDKLEAEIKSETESCSREDELESLAYNNARREGEIAGYQWILYKITGDINGYKPNKKDGV